MLDWIGLLNVHDQSLRWGKCIIIMGLQRKFGRQIKGPKSGLSRILGEYKGSFGGFLCRRRALLLKWRGREHGRFLNRSVFMKSGLYTDGKISPLMAPFFLSFFLSFYLFCRK